MAQIRSDNNLLPKLCCEIIVLAALFFFFFFLIILLERYIEMRTGPTQLQNQTTRLIGHSIQQKNRGRNII